MGDVICGYQYRGHVHIEDRSGYIHDGYCWLRLMTALGQAIQIGVLVYPPPPHKSNSCHLHTSMPSAALRRPGFDTVCGRLHVAFFFCFGTLASSSHWSQYTYPETCKSNRCFSLSPRPRTSPKVPNVFTLDISLEE